MSAESRFGNNKALRMASSPELTAMKWPFKNPKYIFFTDFDGTITLKDSNDYMVRREVQKCYERV